MAGENFSVTIEGLRSIRDLESLPDKQRAIAARAINQVARNTRAKSSKLLRDQIAFGARYLSGKDGKIESSPANPGRLQARLSASSAPRSLARFVKGNPKGRGKVRVEIAPGTLKGLPGAFMLNLNKGSENSLLAVRSATRPKGAYRPRRLGKSLWLLYGPSVSQALLHDDGRAGIWVEIEDDIANALEVEYLRQLKVEGV